MMFEKIANQFINPSLKEDELLHTKAKTLFVLLLFFLFVVISYSSFFIYEGVLFNIKAALNYLGVFVISFCLLLLKRSKKILYPLRVLNYLGLVLTVGGVYWSGGLASNDIFWFLVVSVSSFLFISKVDGLIASLLSVIIITGFYLVDIFQLIQFPFDEFTRSVHYRYINSVIIIIVLVVLVFILVKRNVNLQKVLQETQASQIRESISQDFHDELGNKLASIVHIAKRLKVSKSEEDSTVMLDVIEKESQDVYDNFRDFIWVNDPSSLQLSALFMYLTDFNQGFFAHTETKVEGELLPNDVWDIKVTPIIVRHIIPVFKELMTNVYKYAEASAVDWSITYLDSKLVVTIEDNGDGFDVSEVTRGQGLKSIKKRMLELKADFSVVSTEGKGTKVTLGITL